MKDAHVHSEEDRRRARTSATARGMAHALAQTIEFAVEYYPEIVGAALRKAYGVQALLHLWNEVEARSRGMLELVETVRKYAVQAKELMDEVNDQLDGVKQRLDELELLSERLERRA